MDFAPHFPRTEMEYSYTAQVHGLDNTCPDKLLPNLVLTSQKAEMARAILGGPCKVNSGYRSQALNALVTKGATTTGVHPLGLAVDLLPLGMELLAAFAKLWGDPTFMQDVDQLIIERGCIHVGLPRPGAMPRHEMRRDEWVNGERRYPLIGVWSPRDA